jgi:hypothetical protein
MDELIASFINVTYTTELKNEIRRSFQLADLFQYKYLSINLLDLLTIAYENDSNMLADRFILTLHAGLDYILNEHNITLTEDTSIRTKNEILSALNVVQDLEDYTSIICILESFEDDAVKLSTVISDLCVLDVTDVMVSLESFDDSILTTLKDYIYGKESTVHETITDDVTGYIDNLKVFISLYGDETIGSKFIEGGFSLGEPIEVYLGFLEADFTNITDDKTVAMHVLSLIYMSQGSLSNPIDVYREHSAMLLKDLSRVSAIEVMILDMISKVEEVKNANQLTKSLSNKHVNVNGETDD